MAASSKSVLLKLIVPLLAVLIPLSIVGHRYLPVAADWFDEDSCIGCHRGLNEQLVDQWIDSAHFGANVGCEGCHGTDHDAMFGQNGEVSPKVCAECHQRAYDDFARSKHATAEENVLGHSMFISAPPAMQRQGCLACHAVGRRWPDGYSGRCNDCHSGHRFSAAEAREPEVCEGCHMGPDHPQSEAWRSSKHGIAYALGRDAKVAPTCVTCHLSGSSGHDVTANLTLGRGLSGTVIEGAKPGVPTPTITQAYFEENRARMVKICRDCHSESFAERNLADADEIKRFADGMVAEAAQIIRDLDRDGLIVPSPADRPPNSVVGHRMALGGQQGYTDTSVIEQRFFEMYRFNHARTFKGAYHHSPDYTHWHGYAHMQADLTFIRGEAQRLRDQAKPAKPAIAPPTPRSPTPPPKTEAPEEAPKETP